MEKFVQQSPRHSLIYNINTAVESNLAVHSVEWLTVTAPCVRGSIAADDIMLWRGKASAQKVCLSERWCQFEKER